MWIQSPGGVNVKKILCAVALILVWSVTAQAKVIYLKGGGQIKAQKVWREKGKVVVLVNRDSITTFANSELNLKKTFPPRKKKVKDVEAGVSSTAAGSGSPVQAITTPSLVPPAKGDKKIVLPSLPNKLPEREIPKSGEEGTLRKQKREMEQRLND